jgi:hypothetical protein
MDERKAKRALRRSVTWRKIRSRLRGYWRNSWWPRWQPDRPHRLAKLSPKLGHRCYVNEACARRERRRKRRDARRVCRLVLTKMLDTEDS